MQRSDSSNVWKCLHRRLPSPGLSSSISQDSIHTHLNPAQKITTFLPSRPGYRDALLICPSTKLIDTLQNISTWHHHRSNQARPRSTFCSISHPLQSPPPPSLAPTYFSGLWQVYTSPPSFLRLPQLIHVVAMCPFFCHSLKLSGGALQTSRAWPSDKQWGGKLPSNSKKAWVEPGSRVCWI